MLNMEMDTKARLCRSALGDWIKGRVDRWAEMMQSGRGLAAEIGPVLEAFADIEFAALKWNEALKEKKEEHHAP